VLELRRRVLPPNHEDIGSAFNVIYFQLRDI
jgi:hypothetical protein